jgi:hypothetical protein
MYARAARTRGADAATRQAATQALDRLRAPHPAPMTRAIDAR